MFGEVGGDVPEYFSSNKFSIDTVKRYREKIVLNTLQLEFSVSSLVPSE